MFIVYNWKGKSSYTLNLTFSDLRNAVSWFSTNRQYLALCILFIETNLQFRLSFMNSSLVSSLFLSKIQVINFCRHERRRSAILSNGNEMGNTDAFFTESSVFALLFYLQIPRQTLPAYFNMFFFLVVFQKLCLQVEQWIMRPVVRSTVDVVFRKTYE